MFGGKKAILLLSKTHIKAIIVQTGSKPKEGKAISYAWNEQNLAKVLAAIRKVTGNTIRLLLNDDAIYTTSIIVLASEDVSRDDIKVRSQSQIPENLDETAWDYKEILVLPKQHEKMLQVVAVVNEIYKSLQTALTHVPLTIESIEPVSFAIARLLEHEKTPVVVLHTTDTALLMASYKGLVLATQTRNTMFTPTDISDFVRFVKQQFFVTPTKIFASGTKQGLDVAIMKNLGLTTQVFHLSPAVSTATKKDIVGKDSQSLNLALFMNQKKSAQPMNTTNIHRNRNTFFLFLMFLFFLVVLVLLFFFAQNLLR